MYSTQKDKTQAIENYKKSIETINNIDSIYNLGLIYRDINQNAEAIKYFQMAADRGDKESLYNLGELYDEIGNLSLSEKNYKLSADRDGNVISAYNLGLLYEKRKDTNTGFDAGADDRYDHL